MCIIPFGAVATGFKLTTVPSNPFNPFAATKLNLFPRLSRAIGFDEIIDLLRKQSHVDRLFVHSIHSLARV